MKYEKGKKITDNCQFKKGRKYISKGGNVFEFSHIGENGGLYFKDDGQCYIKERLEYNCIGFPADKHFYEAIEIKELPAEGLLVLQCSNDSYMIYRTGKKTGYGFQDGIFDIEYDSGVGYNFHTKPERWRPATSKEERKFIELLKKECERRGLFEDTKIKECLFYGTREIINKNIFDEITRLNLAWNKNGCIFSNGKFTEPLNEEKTTLDDKITELIELGKSKGLKINVTFES